MIKKKILFIAPVNSIHTVRWIAQLEGCGYHIFLFPALDNYTPHSSLKEVTVCFPFFSIYRWLDSRGMSRYFNFLYRNMTFLLLKFRPDYYQKRLKNYIHSIKPDLIHTLETQGAGYLVAEVKQRYFTNRPFPLWWHTNWGSDIYLFGRLAAHVSSIKEVLLNCNYYSCECNRDVALASQYGFTGHVLPVYPNTGGFEIDLLQSLWKKLKPTSERKIIMLKGYQGWAGRALVALRSIERCANILQGYQLVIYNNTSASDIKIASELFSQRTDIPVSLLPEGTSHTEILQWHGKARISIGLSISDGISTSFLEAMAMGSFPIQSDTSAADEWAEQGVTALIVPAEDTDSVEMAIRTALLDNALVDRAADINRQTILNRADGEKLAAITVGSYRQILYGQE